jgi:hypothetical protein
MTPENLRFSGAVDESAMEGIAITHDAYEAIAAALPQGVDAKPQGRFSFGWTIRSRSVLPRCDGVAKIIPTSS